MTSAHCDLEKYVGHSNILEEFEKLEHKLQCSEIYIFFFSKLIACWVVAGPGDSIALPLNSWSNNMYA